MGPAKSATKKRQNYLRLAPLTLWIFSYVNIPLTLQHPPQKKIGRRWELDNPDGMDTGFRLLFNLHPGAPNLS
jgi:hypothetical protein